MFEISIRQLVFVPSNNAHLQDLHDHIVETSSASPHFQTYIRALDDLRKSFPMDPPVGSRGAPNAVHLAFVWLYKVSDEFVTCLQQRDPIALVILGHFCICK
jgi:hypothetical protein